MTADPAELALLAFHLGVRELLLLTAALIAIFSFDDLIVDLIYFVRLGWRRVTIYRQYPRATADALPLGAPGRFAIIVPAWDEAAVIGAMLRELLNTFDHPDYRVFVGTYPNDPATAAAVRAVADARVQVVVGDRPGPTTKADCLNTLWRSVLREEAASGRRFKAVVLHDAEDVVDAGELRIFDHLIPRLAMAQLPVLPLLDAGSRWVSGHYADEFAEHHAKDLVVREALGAALPSAGVACALERGMLGRIAELSGGAPFDAGSLTEDYEIGHKIKALGGRAGLVRMPGVRRGGVVATAEHFPATLETAVRQKTRWLLGIALSGWDRIGWRGGWADRWFLIRDRKSVASSMLTALAYFAALATLADAALNALWSSTPRPPLAPAGSLLAGLLAWNAAMLGWRLSMRMGFSWRAYGWREGLRAAPRAVVGNLVNALAARRALLRYLRLLRGREALRWDKTVHRYPGVAAAT